MKRAALFALALVACGPATPSPADQAKVATFGAELQLCNAKPNKVLADECMCEVGKKYGKKVEELCK